MKKKVIVFLSLAALLLAILPVTNVVYLLRSDQEVKSKLLYRLDPILPDLSAMMSRFGISLFPSQVVIGKDGWLFLGDKYSEAITKKRVGAESEHTERARVSGATLDLWRTHLLATGVKDVVLMLAPDKSTIYRDYLPEWMRPASVTLADVFVGSMSSDACIDLRGFIAERSRQEDRLLYYKTDTHWNNHGAWLAYDFFMTDVSSRHPEIKYALTGSVSDQKIIPGGDLSLFLRMSDVLEDVSPVLQVEPEKQIDAKQIDFQTKAVKSAAGNPPVFFQLEPLLVVSSDAENDLKVIWLRDSFGTALSPYVARSFREVLQVHYSAMTPAKLDALVEAFRPDYIFITGVERDVATFFAYFADHPFR
ncbi:hypothetical protein [Marichromatium sp. AB32]|uniref:alginate O-acetyltransferase AlgX-related protein n=1 Tax=Marichromatium sp. AB32 TaxID=2483363 RepID=UPI000F3F6626|nr:hypothetical protein [Marichromatium sp. AB32]RNE93896.1 hypothetical protein EBL85_04935 [Marichromatium sp. AB32]